MQSSRPRSLACGLVLLAALSPARGQPKVQCVTDTVLCEAQKVQVERFQPADKGKHPAVLFLPGIDGINPANEGFFRGAAERVAERGFVVLLVHYRGDNGDKEATRKLLEGFQTSLLHPEKEDVSRVILRKQFDSWCTIVRATLAHTRKLDSVAADRVGIVGLSLGGFLASSVALEPNQQVKAVVTMFAGITPESAKRLKHFPAALILWGKKDTIVPPKQSRFLCGLLREMKAPEPKEKEYDVGHCFEGSLWAAFDAELSITAFLKTQLGSREGK